MEEEKVMHPSFGTQILFGVPVLAFFLLALYGCIFQGVQVIYPLVFGVILIGMLYWLRAEGVLD